MEEQTLTVPKISCGHCVNAIQKEISGMAGVSSVTGDPDTKTITVKWDTPASIAGIKSMLEEINYPAQ